MSDNLRKITLNINKFNSFTNYPDLVKKVQYSNHGIYEEKYIPIMDMVTSKTLYKN